MTIDISGRIDGSLYTALRSNDAAAPVSFGVANSGTITNSNGATAASFAIDARENGGTASIDNSGTQARFRMLRSLIGSTDRIGVPDRLVETA